MVGSDVELPLFHPNGGRRLARVRGSEGPGRLGGAKGISGAARGREATVPPHRRTVVARESTGRRRSSGLRGVDPRHGLSAGS